MKAILQYYRELASIGAPGAAGLWVRNTGKILLLRPITRNFAASLKWDLSAKFNRV
jgi:hypothetical protein